MDKSKVNQSQQSFNCGLGQARVNIFNGRLLFEHPLITLGSNSFQMSTSIVYNSHYKSTDFGGKKIGFGNGWKLTTQQYLFPYQASYNIDGFNFGDYIYIDSNWFIHRFVKYKNSSTYGDDRTAYYDDSGTGLKLLVGKNVDAEIFDNNNNTYYFNASGHISGVMSGINADIMKKIEYSNGNVSCIYDSRKPSRQIQFLYNDNGTLKEVFTSVNKIGFTLNYEGDKLSKIIKYSSSESKELMEFRYANNILEYTINSTDLTALRFLYSSFNDLIVVSEVLDVAMKRTLDTSYVESEHYLGENDYLGEGEYSTYLGKKFKHFNTIMGPVKDSTSFTYSDLYTELTSKKGVSIRYYFNIEGTVISSLENKDDNNHYTLFRPNGWELSSDGTSSVTINGQKANILNSNNSFKFSVTSGKLNEFKNIFNLDSDGDGEKDEAYSEHFKVSFWLNFSKNSKSNLLATLNYKINSTPITTSMRIENTLDGAWQYVVIPINLGLNQTTLSDISISFSETSLNSEMLLADVRIERGGTPDIMIGDYKLDTKSTICWNTGSQKISPEFYMTGNDIFATYRSLFYCKKNNQTYFDLVYCNCTKIKSVSYVDLKTSDNKTVRFSIDDNNIPNYYFKLIDIVAEGHWTITEIQTSFHYDDNMGKYYYETKKAIGLVTENPQYRLSDDKANITYNWQNADGTFRATKDTNKVIRENIYDNYGNIELVKTYYEDDCDGESIQISYLYEDGVDKRYRENPVSYVKNGIKTKLNFNDTENIINFLIEEDAKTEYSYDSFNEKMKKIRHITSSNNEIIEENDLKYLDNQMLKTIKNSDGTIYGFGYNIFSELEKIYKNNDLILEIEEINESKEDVERQKVYLNEKNPYITTTIYDMYGNVKIQENSGNIIQIEYENNKASSLINRIKKIIDPYIINNYNITYDDKSIITNTKLSIENYLDTKIYSNNLLEYDIKTDNDVIKFKVDTENFLSQKAIASKYSTKINDVENDNYSGYEDFNYDYKYDKLGRYSSKCGTETVYDKNELNETRIHIEKNITYDLGTELPSIVSYNVISKSKNHEENSTNFYFINSYKKDDETKATNIRSISEKGDRYIENPKNASLLEKADLETRTYKYDYDSINRLVSEENPYFGKFIYKYETNGMLKEVFKNGISVKSFDYNTNQLTCAKIDDKIYPIEYDNYGNILKIGNTIITYNSRNLMDSYEYTANLNTYTKIKEKFNYYYNYQGIRYKKKLIHDQGGIGESITYVNYYLKGNTILGEDWTDNNGKITKKIRYFYDVEGICGLKYDGYNFTLIKDSLGNISKVMYKGKIIGEYLYDAWGNCEVVELSVSNDRDRFVLYNNPFRYSGYYYDLETGLYYCNSRYYEPKLYIWTSPDNIEYINSDNICGTNLYCYCHNNPIKYYDSNGCDAVNREIGKGWTYRIEVTHDGTKRRHIHVDYKENKRRHAQNDDGSVHDGLGGNPPKFVRDYLREKKKWDWKMQFSSINVGYMASPFTLTQNSIYLESIPIFQDKTIVSKLPGAQNKGTIETIPSTSGRSYMETFPVQEVAETVMVVTVVAVSVYIIVCVGASFFTGGQSLLGLLALA